jgi:uncharacterized protein YndB with AHSA1/START domain
MMHKIICALPLVPFLTACGGEAPSTAEAPRLAVHERVELNAPAEAVWRKIKDFNALHRWLPTIAKTEIIRGANNQPGAVRRLSLKAGGTVEQELLAYVPGDMRYTYRIIRGALPVSDYESTIAVQPIGGNRSIVTWSSHFRRKDTRENPTQDANNKAAIDAVKSAYKSGLSNLKKMAERGN